ncbi:MAG TPA: type IV pilus assembly protein PilM [Candidatus Paceibacterota bacterium]|nr:type IV pilus assembly protein PilM [Candidatus Paceibacterota bacterium]HOK97471.1 type IV pilus assembly protein PilM [Candidatus Paceibacterota bacterium]HPP65002.1 type IV pilus assembly protein PilM [Candidatus Paceibacterota bacterium]
MGIFGQNEFLGIDIGTTSIKIVELKIRKERVELSNYGILEKYGHLERINDALQTMSFKLLEESTSLLLKELLSKTKIKTRDSYIALPSFTGFAVLVEFPIMTDKELSQAIKYQAGQYIPMTLQEMTLDWQVEKRTEDRIYVLLIAIPTDIIQRYAKTAELSKLNLKGLELENISLAHLFSKKENAPFVLVDIGGRASSISVIDDGTLMMSRNLDTAGGDITQVIATALGINPFRAEEIKKTYGLYIESKGELNIVSLVVPLLDVIKREIEKVINNYYLKTKKKVEKVILTGGGANLKGLDEYYSKQLLMPVILGNPFNLGLISYNPKLAPILAEIGTNLATACAVALKLK